MGIRTVFGILLLQILVVVVFVAESSAQITKPDLSELPPDVQKHIRAACASAYYGGPKSFYECLRAQKRGHEKTTKPDLSGLPADVRQNIYSACASDYYGGPKYHYDCIRRQAQSIGYNTDSLSSAKRTKKPKPTADEDVARAQRLLAALGYDPGDADGLMGPKTREAINAYRRKKGDAPDGTVSQSLIAALQKDYDVRFPRRKVKTVRIPADRAPKRPISPGGRYVIVPPETLAATDEFLALSMPTAKYRINRDPIKIYKYVKKSVWVVVAAKSRRALERSEGLSQGSAVAVSKSHLVTNCHVLKGRPVVGIVRGQKVLEARIIVRHVATDRCVLAVDEPVLEPVHGIRTFKSLKIGEKVFTVGAPRGLEATLGQGLISGLRKSKGRRLVQTTAPISPGSSGGGLFDESANLLGVTTFLLRQSQSLNFAIAAQDYWD